MRYDIPREAQQGAAIMKDDGAVRADSSARTYRIFVFDQGQCLRRADLIECTDDQAAIASGIKLLGTCLRGWTVEVWHLARRVFPSRLNSLLTLLAADLSDGTLDLFGLLSP
jgi:hypothetical protein